MKEHFVLHTNYKNLEIELRTALQNFSKIGDYVTKGERNIIKKIEVNGAHLSIKKFKNPNFFNRLVYGFLRKSKAKRSFEYASKLIALNINTPFPVGYLEVFKSGLTESYYISEHLNYDFDFRVLNHNPTFPNREEILRQFAKFTFKLHENNINFLDHSPGNTLIIENNISASLNNQNIKTENKKYDFYLIDLNRMRFEPMDLEKRMQNFRRLWLSKTMIKIMALEYSKLFGKTYDEVFSLMTKHSRAFQKKVNSKKLRKKKR